MSVEPGLVVRTESKSLGLVGYYRVLQVFPLRDRVVLIQIPSALCNGSHKKQANYYARGFQSESLALVENWLSTGQLTATKPPHPPAEWAWSDEQLVEACPEGKRVSLEDGATTSPTIIRRDFKWRLIQPLIQLAENGTVSDLSDLDALVQTHAKRSGVSIGQTYDALHRFYASGGIKNALLPNWSRCGAPGKSRVAKNGVKLGRPNAAAAAGDISSAGYICSEQDRQNIEDGYLMYVRPGMTSREAYVAFSATFYSNGVATKHGISVPILLPSSQRPTEREFLFHGPKGAEGHSALRRQLGEGEWARDYRPLVGLATSGIPAIGHLASLDASPIDVNLRAIFDRHCPIGVGRGLFVREATTGLWLGWYIAIGGLGTDAAKLAIYRAATDKSELLRRLDLSDLPGEDFVALFPTKFISDNGELRSADGMESCVSQLASRIEFIERGRADRNSISESGHHSRHRGFDHRLEGTTHGRPNKRGEQPAITKGLLNRYDYERLLVLWIHWANTRQHVPYLVPTEMRRAMQGKRFEPTRINIFRWAKNEGYVTGRSIDPILLKAHLLPTFTATIRRNGLVLHRPNTGRSIELLPNALFNCPYLCDQELYRSTGRYDQPHIQVKADPDDLSQVFLVDRNGIHVIPNVSDDIVIVSEGCIADLSAKKDAIKCENIRAQSTIDQDESDQRAFRLATERSARTEKDEALAEASAKQHPSRATVRENQVIDNAAHLEISASKATSRRAPNAQVKTTTTPGSKPTLAATTPDPALAIKTAIQLRLANFHRDRGEK